MRILGQFQNNSFLISACELDSPARMWESRHRDSVCVICTVLAAFVVTFLLLGESAGWTCPLAYRPYRTLC